MTQGTFGLTTRPGVAGTDIKAESNVVTGGVQEEVCLEALCQ